MAWPDPRDPDDIEWRLAHATQERFGGDWKLAREAAAYIGAYKALIDLPQKTRNARIEQIKRAMEVQR
jgi:hypothetical protein